MPGPSKNFMPNTRTWPAREAWGASGITVIVGVKGGIGGAFLDQLVTSRGSTLELDPMSEDSIAQAW